MQGIADMEGVLAVGGSWGTSGTSGTSGSFGRGRWPLSSALLWPAPLRLWPLWVSLACLGGPVQLRATSFIDSGLMSDDYCVRACRRGRRGRTPGLFEQLDARSKRRVGQWDTAIYKTGGPSAAGWYRFHDERTGGGGK